MLFQCLPLLWLDAICEVVISYSQLCLSVGAEVYAPGMGSSVKDNSLAELLSHIDVGSLDGFP